MFYSVKVCNPRPAVGCYVYEYELHFQWHDSSGIKISAQQLDSRENERE